MLTIGLKLRTALWYIFFIYISIMSNIICSWVFNAPIMAIGVAFWLIIPCKDKHFGNGRKYYLIRQLLFSVGTIITIIVGIV